MVTIPLYKLYRTSAILRKLIMHYPTKTQLLMQQPQCTLEQVYHYFIKYVFNASESGQFTNNFHSIAAPSDCSLRLSNNERSSNKTLSHNNLHSMPSAGVSSYFSSRSRQLMRLHSRRSVNRNEVPSAGRNIPIRAYNPLVPILQGPRLPPPRGTPYTGTAPHAEGNRCIGCGMSGHSTYSCPYGNMPFCYGCKRFGHIRTQCRPEWVEDLPGDAPMPYPPPPPPSVRQRPTQLFAIQQSDPPQQGDYGNYIHVTSI